MSSLEPIEKAYTYEGSELEIFAGAVNWKSYLRSQFGRFIDGAVLDVGAGIGSTVEALHEKSHACWLCLEPDAAQVQKLKTRFRDPERFGNVEVRCGTLDKLPTEQAFDTITYVDVLEHIEDDEKEVETACRHLKPGGHLVVLAPAHEWLFSPMDEAVGHFRRYNAASLQSVIPGNMKREKVVYLDSIGLAASLANCLFLKQAVPSPPQLALWDKYMIKLSRIVDPLFGHWIGKSVLGVWQKRLR